MTFFLPNAPPNAPLSIKEWMDVVKGRLEQAPVLTRGIAISNPLQGDVIYYGGTSGGWSRLAAGINGQFLQTQGTSSNPLWANLTSFLTAGTGIAITGTSTGTVALAAIANNRLLSNTSGTSAAPSANTLTNFIDAEISSTQGSVMFRGTAVWQQLAPGTSTTQFLQTGGTSANPKWSTVATSGTAGGYLSGTYPNPNVINVLGNTTGTSAATGDVGEYISSTVVSTSAVALTSGTAATVTQIALTPGDWDVWGNVAFIAGASTTASVFAGGIGTSAATLPTSPGAGAFMQLGISVSAGGVEPCLPVGSTRIITSGTSTAYLVTQSTFALSTMSGYGFIGARRRR